MPHDRTSTRASLVGNRASTPAKDVEASLDAYIRDQGLSFRGRRRNSTPPPPGVIHYSKEWLAERKAQQVAAAAPIGVFTIREHARSLRVAAWSLREIAEGLRTSQTRVRELLRVSP